MANANVGNWGFGAAIQWPAPYPYVRVSTVSEASEGDADTVRDLIDWNGDGLPDLIVGTTSGPPYNWSVYLNNGQGFDATPLSFTAPTGPIQSQAYQISGDNRAQGGVRTELADFNGDGLPDLLTVPNPYDIRCADIDGDGVGDMLATCMEVYLNTGQGFAASPTLVTLPGTTGLGGALSYIRAWDLNGNVFYDLFDINGDGLPDFVEFIPAGDGRNPTDHDVWLVLLNLGGRLESPVPLDPSEPLLPPVPTRIWPGTLGNIRRTLTAGQAYTYIDMVDLNGDGMLDRVVAGSSTWTIELNQNPTKPNLLTAMDNGLGGMTTLGYLPSTQFDNTGGDGVPDLPFVTWVSTLIDQTDGRCPAPCSDPGHEVRTSVSYRDGRFDPASREFRGFREVDKIDPDGNVESSTFGQSAQAKGRLLERATYGGPIISANLIRRVSNLWTTVGAGASHSQIWLQKSTTALFDLDPTSPYVVSTHSDQPDGYGNITHSYRDGYGSERVDTYTEYATPIGTHVFDKPWHTYSIYAPLGQRFDEKWFQYDGGTDGLTRGSVDRGNVKLVESRLDPGTNNPKTHTTYDSYGNITTVTDALNHALTTTYDSKFLYPYQVIDALGHTMTTVTDYRWGKATSITDQNGAVTLYDYDSAGRLTTVARPNDSLASPSVRYTYTLGTPGTPTTPATLSSVKVERKEPNHPTGYLPTTGFFDGLGRSHHTATFRVVDGVDKTIVSDSIEYDAASRVAKRYDAYPMSSTDDPANPPAPNNGVTLYDYLLNGSAFNDPFGRVHRVTQNDNTPRTMTYRGFSTTSYDEENRKSVAASDLLGRVIERDQYTGTGAPYSLYAATTYTYDGAGRVLTTMQNGNQLTVVSHTYDALGRRTQTIDPDSGTWNYQYDAVGNLLYQDDPKLSQHVQFCYDALNRVTKKFYFANDPLQTIDCVTPSAGNVRFTYDETSTCDQPPQQNKGIGRLTRVTDLSGSACVTYDARGRTSVTFKTVTLFGVSKTAKTSITYDTSDADHVWTTTYPDSEIVTATYDHSGRPKTLVGSSSYVTNATYDVFGRLRVLTHGNATTDTRTYYGQPGSGTFPNGHRPSGAKTQGSGGTYLDLTYATYTPRGLLSQITDNVNADRNVLSNKATFGYDDLARLTSATVYYDSNSPLTLSYGYNALGNLTSKEGSAYTYNATKPHQASLIGGTAISYDLNGSVSSGRNAQQYLFDKDNRLQQATVSGTIVTFAYDYAGQQVAKTVGTSGTRYYSALAEVTDGWLTKYYFFGGIRVASQRLAAPTYLASVSLNPAVLFAQLSPAQPAVVVLLRKDVQLGISVCALLLGGGLLLAPWRRKRVVGIAVRHGHVVAVIIGFVLGSSPWPLVLRPHAALAQTGGTITHFHADHLGSTEVITTSTGALLQQVRYKPFGEIRYRSGTSTNHYEFTGYETDTTSALEYAGARFYDPALALFLTQDPAHQFASPYLYTNGNPTNLTDPNGAAIGFVIFAFFLAFAATFIQASVNGAEPADAAKAGAISGAVGVATGLGLGMVDFTLGAWSASAQVAFRAALIGSGVFTTYEGFSSGQYVLGERSGS